MVLEEDVAVVGLAEVGVDVELAGGDAEPVDEPLDGDLGAFGPAADEVDDGVAGVVGNP